MASSSRRWTTNVSSIAARVFFLLIIFQVPLFRVTCRSGMCTTPIEVTSSQLIASEIFPTSAVKALLYPGAFANGLIRNRTIPTWDNLLNIYNLTDVKEASALADLQRLEVLAGSYFSVAGAFVCLLKRGRMNMFGTLLIIWGLVKEGILGKPVTTDPEKAVYVYPTMLIALVCAFMSIKYDLNKIVKSSPARPMAKPLQSSSKSKLR
ncbi:tail fiber [Thalictrum thalictroides]|uniref:Tail fiber n=1 Tax=Thalictrum thalictroides TaxID=46969 RepID=A0A7J6VK35_THATH|nr:tail fiber [Thalictrum thalictroides]